MTNSAYTVLNVQASKVGDYSVCATDSFGSVTSSDALLTVLLQVRLKIQLADGQIVLSWNDAAYHLQVAPVSVLSAVWTNVSGASPLSLPIGPGTWFFRLISP